MNIVKARIALIVGLILLALGANFLHSNIHPPSEGGNGLNFPNTIGFTLCIIDLFIVSVLFVFRKTTPIAAMINGLIAIYGSIIMVHHGLANEILYSHIPHVFIAAADLLAGVALLRLTMHLPSKQPDNYQ